MIAATGITYLGAITFAFFGAFLRLIAAIADDDQRGHDVALVGITLLSTAVLCAAAALLATLGRSRLCLLVVACIVEAAALYFVVDAFRVSDTGTAIVEPLAFALGAGAVIVLMSTRQTRDWFDHRRAARRG